MCPLENSPDEVSPGDLSAQADVRMKGFANDFDGRLRIFFLGEH